jgi:hypothetical protein
MIRFRVLLFRIASALSLATVVYHVVGIFFAVDSSPAWRHSIFVGVGLFCCYGLTRRPWYFVYFFFVLLVQQYYSHGSFLLSQWTERNKIHWISVLLLIMLPVIFVSLVIDQRQERQE